MLGLPSGIWPGILGDGKPAGGRWPPDILGFYAGERPAAPRGALAWRCSPLSGDQITRLSTGVPGLDQILGGGLPQGSMVFLVGGPGVGKTILAQQLSFQAARAGRPVQFLTTLSEPHDKLLAFLRSFAFFDPEIVGNGIELINLQSLMAASSEETVESIVYAVRK